MKIERITPLKEIKKIKHECKKCGKCCSFGSGFLVKNDVKKIAKFLNEKESVIIEVYLEKVTKFNTTLYRPKLRKENNMPFGKCIFLEENLCSIHPARPLHCKVANHGEHGDAINEWFHLNYFVDTKDPTSIREWDLHVKNRKGKTIAGGKPHEIVGEKIKDIRKYSDFKYDEEKTVNNVMPKEQKNKKKQKKQTKK